MPDPTMEPIEFEDPRLVDDALNRRFMANDADQPLSDDELDRVHTFYYNLERMLVVLGRDFYLARNEVVRRLTKARWMRDNRRKENATVAPNPGEQTP